ncbi:hypothetical protein PpBr36_03777, partial [Pyricularia pennisetigena]|uniref:hypothetical protein n=1 Tax=Pyricularia pennisetigena TaxID=1578925 RepID=UPI00114E5CD9
MTTLSSAARSGEEIGSVFLVAEDGTLLSLPIPSNSPDDPLSWSLRRRCLALSILVLYGTFAMAIQQFPGLLFVAFEKEFGKNILLAVVDLTFVHQRPGAIAATWALSGTMSQVILALVPFSVDTALDWRSTYKFWSIAAFAVFLLALLFVPETYFVRPPVALDGRILVQGGAEKMRVYEGWDQVAGGGPPIVGTEHGLQRHAAMAATPRTTSAAGGQGHERTRLWLRQMRVRKAKGADWRSAVAFFPQLAICLVNPLIFWVCLFTAANFAGMMLMGTTYPMVLTSPPYSLSTRAVGLVSLASAAGALAAWPAAGCLTSRVTNRFTRRSHGVRHAEVYLFAFAQPVVAGVASLVLYGVAVRLGWPAGCVYAAYGLNTFSYVTNGVANTLWATAVFPQWAAAAIAVVGGVSSALSFGLTYAITPWLRSQGYLGTSLELAAVVLVLGLVAVPLAFWGRNVRQYINTRWARYEAGAVRPHDSASVNNSHDHRDRTGIVDSLLLMRDVPNDGPNPPPPPPLGDELRTTQWAGGLSDTTSQIRGWVQRQKWA